MLHHCYLSAYLLSFFKTSLSSLQVSHKNIAIINTKTIIAFFTIIKGHHPIFRDD